MCIYIYIYIYNWAQTGPMGTMGRTKWTNRAGSMGPKGPTLMDPKGPTQMDPKGPTQMGPGPALFPMAFRIGVP